MGPENEKAEPENLLPRGGQNWKHSAAFKENDKSHNKDERHHLLQRSAVLNMKTNSALGPLIKRIPCKDIIQLFYKLIYF